MNRLVNSALAVAITVTIPMSALAQSQAASQAGSQASSQATSESGGPTNGFPLVTPATGTVQTTPSGILYTPGPTTQNVDNKKRTTNSKITNSTKSTSAKAHVAKPLVQVWNQKKK